MPFNKTSINAVVTVTSIVVKQEYAKNTKNKFKTLLALAVNTAQIILTSKKQC